MSDKPLRHDERTVLTDYGDGEKTVSAAPGMEVCDICLSTKVAYSYPAGEVELAPFAKSDDAWAACEPCHELIEADDRNGLFHRAMTGARQRGNSTDTQILNALPAMTGAIIGFMDTRGEGRRINEENA